MFRIQELLSTIATLVISVVVPLLLVLYFEIRFKFVRRLVHIIEPILDKFDPDDAKFSAMTDNLVSLGQAATNINTILSDEEAFDGTLSLLANKIRKSFIGSLLGTASGDSKRMARADTLVNEAVVQGAMRLNPILGIVIKATGLDQVIKDDPEMFDYIFEAIANKGGLMKLIGSQLPNMPTGVSEEDVRAVTRAMKDF